MPELSHKLFFEDLEKRRKLLVGSGCAKKWRAGEIQGRFFLFFTVLTHVERS